MGEKLEKVKTHVKNHKEAYIAGTTGFLVGAVLGVLLVKKSDVSVKAMIVGGWRCKLIQTTIVGNSHPGELMFDNTTGTLYRSKNEAAFALGVSRYIINKHLKGLQSDINGHVLTDVGRAA